MNILKDVKKIFSANLISLITSAIISFLVPIVVSVESYANIKIYALYFSYIGFMHLGFIDGMHIKYGGKKEDDINKEEFKLEHNVFIITQLIITIIFCLVGIAKKDIIILLIAISIIPANGGSFYKLFYQSIGEFSKYSRNTYIYNSLYLIFTLITIIFIKNGNYIFYCLCQVISLCTCFCFFEFDYIKRYRKNKCKKFDINVFDNIKIGIILLISNLSLSLFNSLDLWFIKLFYSLDKFSYYSFAITILSFIQILITTVSVTFYNYISKEINSLFIKTIKEYLLWIGCLAMSVYFIVDIAISNFVPKYYEAIDVMIPLFAMIPYMIIIKGLYINVYKAKKIVNKYFFTVTLMIVISIFYNAVALVIFKSYEYIAVATFLAFITWYVYSSYKIHELKINKKELLYLLLINSLFFITSKIENSLLGICTYISIYLMITCFIYRIEIKKIKIKIKEYIVGEI